VNPVESNIPSRKTDASCTTIDLHYTTKSQAVILAKEFLREHVVSDGEPQHFYTSDFSADKQYRSSPYAFHYWTWKPFSGR
jgi:hypothetical protein